MTPLGNFNQFLSQADLSKEEERRKVYNHLDSSFAEELHLISDGFSYDLETKVWDNHVKIGISGFNPEEDYLLQGSAFTIWSEINDTKPGIIISSMSTFSPENTASYSKIINAAEVLKHYDEVMRKVKVYCRTYAGVLIKIGNIVKAK